MSHLRNMLKRSNKRGVPTILGVKTLSNSSKPNFEKASTIPRMCCAEGASSASFLNYK